MKCDSLIYIDIMGVVSDGIGIPVLEVSPTVFSCFKTAGNVLRNGNIGTAQAKRTSEYPADA